MIEIITKHKNYIIYLIVSIISMLWNMITMHNTLPWCDEVMLVDTPANMYFYGEWVTTAYNRMGEDSIPFATYMPLYIWSIYLWICIVGFSFLKIRFFELLTTLLLGFALIKCLEILNSKRLSISSVCVFSFLFWFSEIMCITYRMARPDMLGALMSICLIIFIIKSIKEDKKYEWQILIFSCLTILSGIQNIVFLFACFTFSLFILRSIKKIIRPAVYSSVGFLIGFVVSISYMACFGEAKAFMFSIIDTSNTLHNLWITAREFILPLFGRTVKVLPEFSSSKKSFLDGFMELFFQKSTFILYLTSILCIGICRTKESLKKTLPFVCLSIFVVLFFNLAGRFQIYYKWTAIIPIILCLTNIIEYKSSVVNKVIISCSVFIITILGLRSMGSPYDDTYNGLVAFIERQDLKEDAKISTVFSTYYAIKPKYKHAYWYEIYPLDLIKNVDYIIFPRPDRDKQHFQYISYDKIKDYTLDFLSSDEYKVETKDSISIPNMLLFNIIMPNE